MTLPSLSRARSAGDWPVACSGGTNAASGVPLSSLQRSHIRALYGIVQIELVVRQDGAKGELRRGGGASEQSCYNRPLHGRSPETTLRRSELLREKAYTIYDLLQIWFSGVKMAGKSCALPASLPGNRSARPVAWARHPVTSTIRSAIARMLITAPGKATGC